MPIPAYDIDYLEAAQEDMGALFDVAINVLKFPYSEFQKLFLNNELSERFGKGDSFVIWGKSGTEIAFQITNIEITNEYRQILTENGLKPILSPEYWAGWSLAYYQWKSGKSFNEILSKISFESIVHLYFPYHEMDILHFCDYMDKIFLDDKSIKVVN